MVAVHWVDTTELPLPRVADELADLSRHVSRVVLLSLPPPPRSRSRPRTAWWLMDLA